MAPYCFQTLRKKIKQFRKNNTLPDGPVNYGGKYLLKVSFIDVKLIVQLNFVLFLRHLLPSREKERSSRIRQYSFAVHQTGFCATTIIWFAMFH